MLLCYIQGGTLFGESIVYKIRIIFHMKRPVLRLRKINFAI